ncbi:MAG: aspartate-semialdehyde dehydrogenase [Proteobacteria bacterium]|nr:aspartate-semialdehyde dehydrogenase [Pseudomonadota bacterium]
MAKVGFIGWRGMVGSVLMERMRAENDFKGFDAIFASTSQIGQNGPDVGLPVRPLENAYDMEKLLDMDIIVTCQGSDYTKKMYPQLRGNGWIGYWIDAASALRMEDDATIVLDPVNLDVIKQSLETGIKNYIGGNCTVSLMLMAMAGLFKKGLIEWVTSMTYQAASGAGAKNMRELVSQMDVIAKSCDRLLDHPESAIEEIDRNVITRMRHDAFPTAQFGAALAGSLIPWIDSPMPSGQTREEWKGYAETNKILKTKIPIPIDGICVRIGAMRCHSQALTIKLKKNVPLEEIKSYIAGANDWVRVIDDNKADTLKYLTPAAVTGTLDVPVGRIRKLNMGPEYLTCFTVGDQLLWGAAEPVRRILKIVLDHIG